MRVYFLIGAIILAATFFIFSCQQGQKEESEVTTETAEEGMAITVDVLTDSVDVVCGMDLHEQAIADTAIYEGQIYGFCSPECKAKFKENPEMYLGEVEETPEVE
jgi:YHS domain-containing protein